MKNYTSSVDASVSVQQIEQILVRAGAKHINKEYERGEVSAVSFIINNPETKGPLPIRLPANPEAVLAVFKRQWPNRNEDRLSQQAKRTAWRLMYDWLLVQLSLIEMRQAELAQVFLPYIWTGRGSFYAAIKEQKFAALTYQPKEEPEHEDRD